MDPKRRAAEAALTLVESGMTVGLGTGSTARHFIDALGEAVAAGKLNNIRGLPTSVASDQQARGLGIPIVSFDDVNGVDLTVDGADEVDPDLSLIKGLGGALLREKVVAQHSGKLIIIADGSKIVPKLGTKGPLPVEVAPFALTTATRFIASISGRPTQRIEADGKPFITNNGNPILHCKFDGIDDPAALDRRLRSHAGVLETGLFIGLAHTVFVADGERVRTLTRGRGTREASHV